VNRVKRILQVQLGLIAVCAIMYVHLFVPGPGNGADFVDFYAGSYATAHGLDPFVDAQLWQAQKVLFYGGGAYHGPVQVYSYKNPPPFALLIEPLTRLSMSDAYWIWAAVIFLTIAAAARLFCDSWPPAPRWMAVFTVACCPASLWGYRVGQNSAFIALGLALAVWLNARNRPLAAGVALTLGFMKPHLMLPIAIVFCLSMPFQPSRRVCAGIMIGTAIWTTLAISFDGGITGIAHWASKLRGDSTLFSGQADVAALPGLLYHAVPDQFDGVITLLSVLCAGAVVAYFVLAKHNDGALNFWTLGGGISGCLCFLPYEHTSDQIVLALLLLPLIGPDGRGLGRMPVVVAAFACILAPLVLFHDHRTMGFDVLPPTMTLVAFFLARPRPAKAIVAAPTRPTWSTVA
jgi:Glycosyltransferase family 87